MKLSRKTVALISIIIVTSFFFGTAVFAAAPEGTGLEALWDAIFGIEQDVEDLQSQADLQAQIDDLKVETGILRELLDFLEDEWIPGPAGPEGPQGETGPQGEPGAQGPMMSIPHNSSYTTNQISISSSTWDWKSIDDHNVTITLEEDSHVVILYTMTSITNQLDVGFNLRAWIDGPISTYANPPEYGFMTPSTVGYASLSCHFYMDLTAGEYTIHIQCQLPPFALELEPQSRGLTVFAIPN